MDSYHKYRRRATNRRASVVPFLILITAVAGAAVVAFSPLGTKLRDDMIAPIIQRILNAKETPAPLAEAMAEYTASPTVEPTEEPLVKETLTVTQKPFYILQMGHYENEKDASIVSDEIQSMGGAGFIWLEDGVYRLFAAAYTDAASLQTVQAQIRRDGFVNESYITESSILHIALEGQPDAVGQMEEAATLVESIPIRLSELTLLYDKGEIDKTALKAKLDGIAEAIATTEEKMQVIDDIETDRIMMTLHSFQNALSTYLNGYDTITQDYFAGSLKHLQLETIFTYIDFFKESDTDG